MKLNTLMSMCAGRALDAIHYCVLKPPAEGYESAMNTLRQRFGNTAVIVQAWVRKIMDRPRVDIPRLGEFADDLENCYQALSALGFTQELNNQSSLRQIVGKLPKFLQNRWSSKNYELKSKNIVPELEHVVKFVRASTWEVNDPVFGNGTREAALAHHKLKKTSFSTSIHFQQRSKGDIYAVCSQSHPVETCRTFLGMKRTNC
ncbi:uncharacterized protein LOC117100026 [Anneissia japonica]|uniref:uncharacterized protein LOC117100026 n=1 Tax=Anneissia japonica TaxID=1529436 RepID=UPI001425B0B0|nr:uncharacterized protein LOC117100026 [Anneissia japonica]